MPRYSAPSSRCQNPLWLTTLIVATLIAWPHAGRADLFNVTPTMNIRDDEAGVDVTNPGGVFASVGKISGPASGSGTLIGSNWVLTAAHIASAGSANSFSFHIGGNSYAGAETFVDPAWSGDLSTGDDIALIRLANAVTNVAPARLFDGSLSVLGKAATMVGYGVRGTGSAPGSLTGGVLQVGRNIIDVTGAVVENSTGGFFNDRILFTDFDSPTDPTQSLWGSADPIYLESNVTSGDSGGGLFVNFGSGNLLVGVTSFLAYGDGTKDGDYGDASGFTSVADHLDFITSNSGIAPAAVPEAPAWLLMTIALAGLAILRLAKMHGGRASILVPDTQ